MEISKGKIGNALTSVAGNHVVAVAADIYDEKVGEYQEDINNRVADRTAVISDGNVQSLGYKILKKEVSFAQQIQGLTNTIFEVRYNFDLGGASVTIPEKCVLKFEGGSLANGIIVGQDTYIAAKAHKIFSDLILEGHYTNKFNVKWFGAVGNGEIDDTSAIQKATEVKNVHLYFPTGLYLITGTIDGYANNQHWEGEKAAVALWGETLTESMGTIIYCKGDNGGVPFVYPPRRFEKFGIRGESVDINTPKYETSVGVCLNEAKQFVTDVRHCDISISYFGIGFRATTAFSVYIEKLRVARCYNGLDFSSEVYNGLDSGYITCMYITNYEINMCLHHAIIRGMLGDKISAILNVYFMNGVIEGNGDNDHPQIVTTTSKDIIQGGHLYFTNLYSEGANMFCVVRGLSIQLKDSILDRTAGLTFDYGSFRAYNSNLSKATITINNYEAYIEDCIIYDLILPKSRVDRQSGWDSYIRNVTLMSKPAGNERCLSIPKLSERTSLDENNPFDAAFNGESKGVMGYSTEYNIPVVWCGNTKKWRDFNGYIPAHKYGDIADVPKLSSDCIGQQYFATDVKELMTYNGNSFTGTSPRYRAKISTTYNQYIKFNITNQGFFCRVISSYVGSDASIAFGYEINIPNSRTASTAIDKCDVNLLTKKAGKGYTWFNKVFFEEIDGELFVYIPIGKAHNVVFEPTLFPEAQESEVNIMTKNVIEYSVPNAEIGSTSERPGNLTKCNTGYQYYDTSVGKPIWWNGSAWIDGTGVVV